MKPLIAAVLSVTAASCGAQQSNATQNATSADAVFIQEENIKNFKSDQGAMDNLLKKLSQNADYEPHPTPTMTLKPHYSSTGVNDDGEGKPFQDDSRMAYNFALGYALTGEQKYAAKAQGIIDAWSATLKNLGSKQSMDVINFNVQYMVIGASLVRNANGWDPGRFNHFLRSVALPASTQANPNNHGLWGIFMEASIYRWLGDRGGLSKIRERWMQHLAKSIDTDGIMANEIQRSGTNNWTSGPDKGIKGIAYTHYALLPATMAATIFGQAGMPVWQTASGRKLEMAFRKAAYWTRHPETFPYYKSNNGKLDAVDSAPYFYILEKVFPDENAEAELESGKISGGGFYLDRLYGRKP